MPSQTTDLSSRLRPSGHTWDMAIFWLVLMILFILIAGAALGRSPSFRLRRRSGPGEPGAYDPTGNPVPPDHTFDRPSNEGDLL